MRGADISKYQSQPDFNVLRDNIEFIIIKVSEGTGYTDSQFKRNQSEARRVGLGLGYYHFSRPDLGNTPEAEANYFIQAVGTPQTGEVFVLDFEVNYTGDKVAWCKKFLDACASKLNGTKPLIYLNKSQILGLNWQPVIDGGYGLWAAFYDNKPTPLGFDTPWSTVAMKQYTSSGSLPGISGTVDLNNFYGDLVTFKKYGYQGVAPIPPTPSPITSQTKIPGNLLSSPEFPVNEDMEVQRVRSELQVLAKERNGLKDKITNAKNALD